MAWGNLPLYSHCCSSNRTMNWGIYPTRSKKLRLKHDFVNLESAGDICYTFAEEKSVCISIKEDNGNEYQWVLDTSEAGSEEVGYTYTGSDIHGLSLFDDRFIISGSGANSSNDPNSFFLFLNNFGLIFFRISLSFLLYRINKTIVILLTFCVNGLRLNP